jgi:Uma2 family endonuclease
MNAAAKPKQSLEAFLAWENAQETRNEFVNGEVFAMVGVRREHGVVSTNLVAALRTHLKGSACQVFSEALKLQVFKNIFYPDIFVTCSPKDLRTEMIFTEPKLIVEVQSESTSAYDRGVKFANYRAITTLEEYVIVEPQTKRVEVFRKLPDGVFGLYDYSEAQTVEFKCLGFTMLRVDVFDGVEPPAAT